MPTQVANESSNNVDNKLKVKTAYNGEVMITYIDENITYDELCREIRGICRFSPDQVSILLTLTFNFILRHMVYYIC